MKALCNTVVPWEKTEIKLVALLQFPQTLFEDKAEQLLLAVIKSADEELMKPHKYGVVQLGENGIGSVPSEGFWKLLGRLRR